MRIIDIKESHGILLEIAKDFHRVCVDNDIPYYMMGGTMLGAIRHKGFIPWDDDMDFGIPRKDYYRFIEVAQKQMKSEYHVFSYKNLEWLCKDTLKIADIRTIVEEHNEDQTKDPKQEIGINIDVFPLDYSNGHTRFLSPLWKINELNNIYLCRNRTLLDNQTFRQRLEFLVSKFAKMSKEELILKSREIIGSGSNGDYIANYYGYWGGKEFIPKKIYGQPVLYDFEDTSFFGQQDYDGYLKLMYGDYMKLPEKENRHVHFNMMYWKE